MRYFDKCEEVELLGRLDPNARPIETSAHTSGFSSFTDHAIRSFNLKAPCTPDQSCRVHWSLELNVEGTDDLRERIEWREDEPVQGWRWCPSGKRQKAEESVAGGGCTTSWH